MSSKHKALFKFIKQYPYICDLFSFNFMDLEHNTGSFRVIDDDEISEDILGNRYCIYKFSVAENKPFSTDCFSTENIENLEAIDDFIRWVKLQNENHHYPDLGKNCRVEKITAKRSDSGITGIDPLGHIVQYTFTVMVEYEELEE